MLEHGDIHHWFFTLGVCAMDVVVSGRRMGVENTRENPKEYLGGGRQR